MARHEGTEAGGRTGPSSGPLSISRGRGVLSVFFIKLGSPIGKKAPREGCEDEFLWIFSWSEGGRGWLHKSVGSPKVWSLGLSKFSRVLCAVVRCVLGVFSQREERSPGLHATDKTGREGAEEPLPAAFACPRLLCDLG